MVANIAEAYYTAERGFTWGLMAYPFTDSDSNQKFTVVTYWVE